MKRRDGEMGGEEEGFEQQQHVGSVQQRAGATALKSCVFT